MANPKLTESKILLTCQHNNIIVNEVWYAALIEEDGKTFTHKLCIPVQDFIDMGAPDQITITIEPGDTLNA